MTDFYVAVVQHIEDNPFYSDGTLQKAKSSLLSICKAEKISYEDVQRKYTEIWSSLEKVCDFTRSDSVDDWASVEKKDLEARDILDTLFAIDFEIPSLFVPEGVPVYFGPAFGETANVTPKLSHRTHESGGKHSTMRKPPSRDRSRSKPPTPKVAPTTIKETSLPLGLVSPRNKPPKASTMPSKTKKPKVAGDSHRSGSTPSSDELLTETTPRSSYSQLSPRSDAHSEASSSGRGLYKPMGQSIPEESVIATAESDTTSKSPCSLHESLEPPTDPTTPSNEPHITVTSIDPIDVTSLGADGGSSLDQTPAELGASTPPSTASTPLHETPLSTSNDTTGQSPAKVPGLSLSTVGDVPEENTSPEIGGSSVRSDSGLLIGSETPRDPEVASISSELTEPELGTSSSTSDDTNSELESASDFENDETEDTDDQPSHSLASRLKLVSSSRADSSISEGLQNTPPDSDVDDAGEE